MSLLKVDKNIALTDVGFATIMHGMKSLTTLELFLPNIRSLAIRGAQTGDNGVVHIVNNLPNLEVLDISKRMKSTQARTT